MMRGCHLRRDTLGLPPIRRSNRTEDGASYGGLGRHSKKQGIVDVEEVRAVSYGFLYANSDDNTGGATDADVRICL